MLPALIGAGSSLASGVMSMIGASQDSDDAREFAQKGIRWRVKDAEAAGIHPLYALGAQVSMPTPVGVGDAGTHFANAGQDLARAMDSTRTKSERVSAVNKSVMDAQLTNMHLQNELLSAQIAKIRSGVGPAMPGAGDRFLIPGQGETNVPAVSAVPMKPTMASPENPATEPAPVSDVGFATTRSGYAPVMSKDVQERLEDDVIGMLMWNVRNRLLPSFHLNTNAPTRKNDRGMRWIFNPFTQEYQQVPIGGWHDYLGGRFID